MLFNKKSHYMYFYYILTTKNFLTTIRLFHPYTVYYSREKFEQLGSLLLATFAALVHQGGGDDVWVAPQTILEYHTCSY